MVPLNHTIPRRSVRINCFSRSPASLSETVIGTVPVLCKCVEQCMLDLLRAVLLRAVSDNSS